MKKTIFLLVILVITMLIAGCTESNTVQDNSFQDSTLKQFNNSGIKFSYNVELEEHLGGLTGASDTVVSFTPTMHDRSSISVHKFESTYLELTDELIEIVANDESTNSVEKVTLSGLPAYKQDYNSPFQNQVMHCVGYATIKNYTVYLVNYCLVPRECDPDLEVEIIEGFIENDCDSARIAERALFKTDMDLFLNPIVDSFTITD